MRDMTIGSLFSGIAGIERGLEAAGLGPVVWQVEKDEWCRRTLARHYPNTVRYEDVLHVGRHNLAPVRIVCGGFPCQDISPAGTRLGLDGERSGLWWQFRRIVAELLPSVVVIENNGHRWRTWVPVVRRELYALGYASVPLRVRASDVGAWHERDRVFVLADRDGLLIREQSRRWSWQDWEGAVELTRSRAPWPSSDAHCEGQPQSQRHVADERGWFGDCVGEWTAFAGTIEPAVARGVHGIPDRVDAERALGNAVVPQAAEVVGRIIVELERRRIAA